MIESLPRFACWGLPGSPLDKTPILKGWRNPPPAVQERWWPLTGVPTGAVSGIDVLDVDPEGTPWLDQHFDAIPPTRTHETRRGGRHLLFRARVGARCSAGRIAPGIDVRAEGGFIIWWPRQGLPVSDAPIAEWPDWLAEFVIRATVARSSPVVTSLELPTWDEALANHHKTAARWSREETFALFGLDKAMQRVARAPNGTREATFNGETYAIGRLVGAGWIELSRSARGMEIAILSNTNVDARTGLTFAQEYGRERIRLKILHALHDGMARPYPPLREVTTKEGN